MWLCTAHSRAHLYQHWVPAPGMRRVSAEHFTIRYSRPDIFLNFYLRSVRTQQSIVRRHDLVNISLIPTGSSN